MALEVKELKRVFKYKDTTLKDISGLSLREIAKHYSGIYPELLNSTAVFSEIKNNVEIYSFDAKAGLKG